ncbi:hypothetical protein Tco_1130157 [Tanacetum coccineum]
MATLESCPKYNMVGYLEKTNRNAKFHEIIDFLTCSSIHYALTISPVVSTTFVEQFWMSAKSKIINNVRYIPAKVASKPLNISEASIRSDLLFDDADGIDSLHNQAIFDAIQLMGTAPTTVFRDDETIAEFLVSMSQNKAKQKGVEIKDAEDSDRPRATSTRSVLTLKPLPKIDPKDKGKKVLEEEAESDAESEGVDKAERKLELAARLQEEERETFTVKERAKFLYVTIAAQRRFLAQQRAAAIRSIPPTRTQLKNQMMTYLKHVGGKKHADLKNKYFEEIQVLYKEVKRSDKNFIAIGSAKDETDKGDNEESKDPKKED